MLDGADVHEMATAAGWAPGGGRVAVGTLKGKVRFYAVDDVGHLEYEAQIGEGSAPDWCPCRLPCLACEKDGMFTALIAHPCVACIMSAHCVTLADSPVLPSSWMSH